MTEAYLFGAMDGNIHQLRLASVPDTDPAANGTWSDQARSPVIGRYRSKEITGGSWHMVKQVRQVLIDLEGDDVTATLLLRKTNGTVQQIVLPDTSVPSVSNDVPDQDTAPKLCKSFAIQVEGQHLNIKEITIVWRGHRMNSGQI